MRPRASSVVWWGMRYLFNRRRVPTFEKGNQCRPENRGIGSAGIAALVRIKLQLESPVGDLHRFNCLE